MGLQKLLDNIISVLLHDEAFRFPRGPSLNEDVILSMCQSKSTLEALENWFQEHQMSCQALQAKSFEKAEVYRREGNSYFVRGQIAKALTSYNNSIRHYPIFDKKGNSNLKCAEGLAIAYANRSAIFFDKKDWQKCLNDIERALTTSYPENLKYKLLKRKAESLLNLSEFDDAKKAIEKAQVAIVRWTDIDSKKGESIIAAVKTLKDRIIVNEKLHIGKSMGEFKESPGKDDSVQNRESKITSHISEELELKFDLSKGRHFTAKKSLSSGERVIVEGPYASYLMPEWYNTNCHHCYEKTDAVIPCNYCSLVSYCSAKCMHSSWDQYHHVECDHLLILKELGISHLALRIILKTNISELLSTHHHEQLKSDYKKLSSGIKHGCHDNYEAIYNLVSHEKDISQRDLLSNGLTAFILMLILKNGAFFEKLDVKSIRNEILNVYEKIYPKFFAKYDEEMRKNISPAQLLVSSLLCHHIHQLAFNAIAITRLNDLPANSSSSVTEFHQIRLATAVYPTASLLNHSCNPTCIQSFVGNKVVIQVTKSVNPGDEISITYGPHYQNIGYKEQLVSLQQQYLFKCACTHCKGMLVANNSHLDYRCMNCLKAIQELESAKCSFCEQCFDPEEYKSLENLAKSFFLKSQQPPVIYKPNICLEYLNKCLELQGMVYHKCHRRLAFTHNAIAQCLAMQEDYSNSIYHVKKCLEINKVIYGEHSIEVGYELLTLSDLLIKCIHSEIISCSEHKHINNNLIKECKEVVRKALDNFSHISASASDEINDLKEKEQFLLDVAGTKKE